MDDLISGEEYSSRDDLFALIETVRQETDAKIIFLTNGRIVIRYRACHPPEYSVCVDMGHGRFYAEDDEFLSGYNLGTVRGAERLRQLARRLRFSYSNASVWQVVRVEQEGIEDYMIITADADTYHVACAKQIYGADAIDTAFQLAQRYSEHDVLKNDRLFAQWPKDREGNLIHVDEGKLESPYDCGLCNGKRVGRMASRRASAGGGQQRHPVKLYATSLLATGRQGNVAHCALAALAANEAQAQEIGMSDAERFFPSSQGWQVLGVSAFAIPQEALDDLYQSRRGMKLYATSILALDRLDNPAHCALAALAIDEVQANEIAMNDSKRFFPPRMGWQVLGTGAFEIPQKALSDLASLNVMEA